MIYEGIITHVRKKRTNWLVNNKYETFDRLMIRGRKNCVDIYTYNCSSVVKKDKFPTYKVHVVVSFLIMSSQSLSA